MDTEEALESFQYNVITMVGRLERYCDTGWRCPSTANPNGENTNQNMSRWATANTVRIYDIFFASSPSPTVNTTLAAMANANSGFYEFAPSG